MRSSGDRDARAELPGFIEWAASLEPPPPLPEVQPSDVAVIIYTSGTTGKPKGVMLTQGNIVAEISSALQVIRVDENDNLLCLLPLQHVFASIINVLVPLWLGAQVTFIDTLKRAEIMEALQQAGITILATVPQFFYLFHGRISEELGRKPAPMRAPVSTHDAAERLLRPPLASESRESVLRPHTPQLRQPSPPVRERRLGFRSAGGPGFPRSRPDDPPGLRAHRNHRRLQHHAGREQRHRLGRPPTPGTSTSRSRSPTRTGIGEVLIRGPGGHEGLLQESRRDRRGGARRLVLLG